MNKKNSNKLDLENNVLIEKFKNYLFINGFSKHTVVAYKHDLKQFQEINDYKSLKIDIDDQFKNFIQNYKTPVGNTDISQISYRSLVRKVTAIRSFYNYLLEIKEIDEKPNLVFNLKTRKIKKQSLKILSKEEIESLVQSCKYHAEKFDKKKLFWLMMETLIEVLYSSGMRISECLSLKINQVFDNTGLILNEVSIIGKGGKSRIIFLNHRAQESILKFLKEKFESDNFLLIKNCKDYLFNTRYLQFNRASMEEISVTTSRMGIHRTMKNLAIVNNIHPFKVSPHAFRHSIAVHLLLSENNKKQNNIALIKSFLGHESIDTTRMYLNYEDANSLKNVLMENHPLMRLVEPEKQ